MLVPEKKRKQERKTDRQKERKGSKEASKEGLEEGLKEGRGGETYTCDARRGTVAQTLLSHVCDGLNEEKKGR